MIVVRDTETLKGKRLVATIGFTLELSRLPAKEFITTVLADRLHVDTLLIGYDHRFGHNREDGFEQYVTYGEACDMRVIKASQYSEGEAAVSSSEIRTEGKYRQRL